MGAKKYYISKIKMLLIAEAVFVFAYTVVCFAIVAASGWDILLPSAKWEKTLELFMFSLFAMIVLIMIVYVLWGRFSPNAPYYMKGIPAVRICEDLICLERVVSYDFGTGGFSTGKETIEIKDILSVQLLPLSGRQAIWLAIEKTSEQSFKKRDININQCRAVVLGDIRLLARGRHFVEDIEKIKSGMTHDAEKLELDKKIADSIKRIKMPLLAKPVPVVAVAAMISLLLTLIIMLGGFAANENEKDIIQNISAQHSTARLTKAKP